MLLNRIGDRDVKSIILKRELNCVSLQKMNARDVFLGESNEAAVPLFPVLCTMSGLFSAMSAMTLRDHIIISAEF